VFGRFSSAVGLVGIDFSGRGAKMLQLRDQGGELHVVGAGLIETALPTPVGGGVVTAEQLRAAFTSGGFTGRRCVVSLPRKEVHLQSVRMPRMPDHEMKAAASWEAAQRFNLDREKMQVDYIRTGAELNGNEAREELLLIAISHETLLPRLAAVMEAGLRPVAVDTDFGAVARTFSRHCRREADTDSVRAVLDVGLSGSTVTILRGPEIAFCKALSIGGRDLTRAVSEHLQMDEAAAAELRTSRIRLATTSPMPADQDPSTDRAVYEAVRPLLGELVKEVMLCLRYYGVTFRGSPPERLIICGGDGLEPRLDSMLSQTCKLPAAYDAPYGTLGSIIGEIQTTLNRVPGPAACWAAVAGLSMRNLMNLRTARTEAPAAREAA
jgi:type IV pilus assembly protein PilM